MSNRLRQHAKKTKENLRNRDDVPLDVQDSITDFVDLVMMALDYFGATSNNSHVPPSKDLEKTKKSKKPKSEKKKRTKKPGGQPGHRGRTLELVDEPDKVVPLKLDKRKLPAGEYQECEPERRQVFDIEVTRVVTEYQAQVLVDENGKKFVAEFPEEVRAPAQYGNRAKALALSLGVKHSMPFERLSEHLDSQFGLPVSTGTLVNWEKWFGEQLEKTFEPEAISILKSERGLCCFDESGINIAGLSHWAHEANNGKVVMFFPHENRGKTAMDDFGILPEFQGIALHDFWQSYYRYDCEHALCNAHHLRDLEKIAEDDTQTWAVDMKYLLLEMKTAVAAVKRRVSKKKREQFEQRYDDLVKKGLRKNPGTRMKGRRRTKARCLLDRFRDHKQEVLRFLHDKSVPFTNNDAERPIRMLKVEMKISGTFRSLKTAKRSLLIRSYLLTCKNHGIDSHTAIARVFDNNIPSFQNLAA